MKNIDENQEQQWKSEINTLCQSMCQKPNCFARSKYDDEISIEDIDFYRHIRNAVAHSKCEYTTIGNENYITFEDSPSKSSDKNCQIKMRTTDAGALVEQLIIFLMNYLNKSSC